MDEERTDDADGPPVRMDAGRILTVVARKFEAMGNQTMDKPASRPAPALLAGWTEPCPACGGTGAGLSEALRWPCGRCDGLGHILNADGVEALRFLAPVLQHQFRFTRED